MAALPPSEENGDYESTAEARGFSLPAPMNQTLEVMIPAIHWEPQYGLKYRRASGHVRAAAIADGARNIGGVDIVSAPRMSIKCVSWHGSAARLCGPHDSAFAQATSSPGSPRLNSNSVLDGLGSGVQSRVLAKRWAHRSWPIRDRARRLAVQLDVSGHDMGQLRGFGPADSV